MVKRKSNILSSQFSTEVQIPHLKKSQYKGRNGKLGWIIFSKLKSNKKRCTLAMAVRQITLFYKHKAYKHIETEIHVKNKHMWCVARFWISHYLAFAWSFERMLMHANALFYLHIVFIRLHELAWHSNGSIKCQTFECHSNG